MLSKAELEEIAKRAEAATPGPWLPSVSSEGGQSALGPHHEWDEAQDAMEKAENDAIFIAHARTDIPKLLAHIAELEAEIGKLTT